MHADTVENVTGNTIADEIHLGSHYYEIFLRLSAFTFSNLEKHLVLAANCHLTIHRFSKPFWTYWTVGTCWPTLCFIVRNNLSSQPVNPWQDLHFYLRAFGKKHFKSFWETQCHLNLTHLHNFHVLHEADLWAGFSSKKARMRMSQHTIFTNMHYRTYQFMQ